MNRFVLFLSFFGLLATFCKAEPNDLIGTYSIIDAGQWTEYLRVERQGETLFVRQKSAGQWGEQVALQAVTKDQLARVLGIAPDDSMTGMAAGGLVFGSVRKGWQGGNFRCDTGFWARLPFGIFELKKS